MTTGEEQIREVFADDHVGRDGPHYGPYGTACITTGQFDAGECWKCEIKRLRIEREALKDQLNGYENPWKDQIKQLAATLAEFQKDYCPAGCIFGLNKHGKLHLYGDCRTPESEYCKANSIRQHVGVLDRGGSNG